MKMFRLIFLLALVFFLSSFASQNKSANQVIINAELSDYSPIFHRFQIVMNLVLSIYRVLEVQLNQIAACNK